MTFSVSVTWLRRLLTSGTLVVALTLAAEATAQGCAGDCDGDGVVSVAEIVSAVNIGLGFAALDTCAAADTNRGGTVTIPEMIAAVAAGLGDCAPPAPTPSATSVPTPSAPPAPTPSATSVPTASATSLPTPCGDGVLGEEEECDDGNTLGADGCDDRCQLEPGGDPCAGVEPSAATEFGSVLFASGLSRPVHVTAPPLDPTRVFIVEQAGRIRVVRDGALLEAAFLDITDDVGCCQERGLLSLAFHPLFEENGRFFVNYTRRDGDSVIERFEVSENPNVAAAATRRVLLIVDQPFTSHNGGQLAFGPDGYLYAGFGDGGAGGDPLETAQNDRTVLGKLLRVDVDVDDPPYYAVPADNPSPDMGRPLGLIWAKGLRNPWRFSFDRATGDLYIGDVGQSRFEEIDVQPGDSRGGENYGWDVFEGLSCFEPDPLPECPAPGDDFVEPVLVYGRDDGCSVTGGFVYRGCAVPALHGRYFYADYCTEFVRSFILREGLATDERDWTDDIVAAVGERIDRPSSFGEDARGELYVADLIDGEIFKLVPADG